MSRFDTRIFLRKGEQVDLVYGKLVPRFTRAEIAEVLEALWEAMAYELESGRDLLLPEVGKMRQHYSKQPHSSRSEGSPPVRTAKLHVCGPLQQRMDDRHKIAFTYRDEIRRRGIRLQRPIPIWLKPYYPDYPYGFE